MAARHHSLSSLVAIVLGLGAANAVADDAVAPEATLPAAEATPTASDVGIGSTGEVAQGWLTTRTNGWLDSRMSYTRVGWDHLVPSNDVPSLANLIEANMQLKLRWRDSAEGLADVSLLYQRAGIYYGQDAAGNKVRLPDHNVDSLHPATVVSEFYGTWHPSENLHLTLGKKRITWGPGLTLNPTDLLNPPKDPSDPSLQRAGAWLARAEMPFESWTLSLVAAAKVTRQYGGVPAGLVYYPDYPQPTTLDKNGQPIASGDDTRPHFALAARGYLLWQETDINAIAYMTQLYNDAFEWKPRFGLTGSHVFANAWEVHVEALGQTGSARNYFDPACVASTLAFVTCKLANKVPAGRTKLDDGVFRPRVIVGTRYMFGDAASVTAEYLFNGDGYNREEFGAYMSGLQLFTTAQRQGLPMPVTPGLLPSAPSDPGSPQRFAFEPLRRHYALLSYQQSQIADDWTVMALLLLDLEDFSGTLAPTVIWSAQEWLNLTASAFALMPGFTSLGGLAGNGARYTEYGVNPIEWRAFLSARAFY